MAWRLHIDWNLMWTSVRTSWCSSSVHPVIMDTAKTWILAENHDETPVIAFQTAFVLITYFRSMTCQFLGTPQFSQQFECCHSTRVETFYRRDIPPRLIVFSSSVSPAASALLALPWYELHFNFPSPYVLCYQTSLILTVTYSFDCLMLFRWFPHVVSRPLGRSSRNGNSYNHAASSLNDTAVGVSSFPSCFI